MYLYMILKLTNLIISDTTNGVWVKIFHLYKGFFRKYTTSGLVSRGSIRKIKAPALTYKSIKYKSLKIGYSRRCLIISSHKNYKLNTDFNYNIFCNASIIFGKRKSLKGNAITGIMSKQVKQRKYLNKAPYVI